MDGDLAKCALEHLDLGNFTRLEKLLRDEGVTIFDVLAVDGYSKEHLDEACTWACMLGRVDDVEKLLDLGADAVGGMKSGLSGFHYAASSGRLNVIKLLIDRKVPMEVKGMYDNTVLGQALWSAIHEHTPDHAEIVTALIRAGAHVWPNTLEWWNEQDVPSAETKQRIADALRIGA